MQPESSRPDISHGVFAQEIAERQWAERALYESEERLRLFVENVPAAIAMFDREMRYMAVSRRWRMQYFGGRECLGHCHYDVFPDCPERWRAAHRKGIAGEIVHVDEDVWQRADGVELWARYEVRPWHTADGGIGGIIIFIEDITESKRTEVALRESEERLTRAETLANVGNWSADLVNNRLVWSKGMFRIFGKSDEFPPTFEGWLAAVMPYDVDRVRQWCSQCLTDKRALPIEFQISRSDGEIRTLASTAEIVFDDDGQPIRLFGTIQDITDSRRAQQELFASQKLESVGMLASVIAHDFNNLLGGVLIHAEVALAELSAGANPVQELNTIRTTAIRGAEIVRELLVYAGKESAEPSLVDLSRTISEMLELLTISVSKHAVLESDLGRDLPPILGSAAQLRQVVLNLVTNASQAIGERGGTIRVITRIVRRSMAGPEHFRAGNQLQLEVSDTGCGMSVETQARAFDPFFTTKLGGHGLGLTMVQGIVRGLDGSIDVRSEPGRGTSFVITLPCAPVQVLRTDDAHSEHDDLTPVGRDYTLLVVEDEKDLRTALVKLLQKRGFEVLEAADGSTAIDVLRTTGLHLDLVLLDMTIPGASSQVVVREVEQTRPGVGVLLTSAYGEDVVRDTLTGPQIRGYVRKPFQFANLLHSIRSALPS